MRPRGSADLLEDRRRRALAPLDEGLSLNEVGRRIGCALPRLRVNPDEGNWKLAREKSPTTHSAGRVTGCLGRADGSSPPANSGKDLRGCITQSEPPPSFFS